jgi:hypothetical protein
VVSLALEKRLFLNVRWKRLLVSPFGKKLCDINERFSGGPMKWAHHPNLRKRPRTPAKGRGSVQRAIRRAFAASGTEALTSSAIYDWAHIRRRLGRRKSMPFGVYSRTLRTLRAMCDPIERVPPHGAWLWRLRNTADN